MICMFLYLLDQSYDLIWFCKIGWDGEGFALETKVVEGGAGFFAGFGFARGDEDLGAAGLEEAGGSELLARCYCVFVCEACVPRCSMQSQSSRSTCHDCNFAIEGEDVLEVL